MTRDELDQALERLRVELTTSPDSDVRTKHLAAMKAAFVTPNLAPRRIRRPGFARRVAVGAAAFVLVGGTAMAATGTLPAPAQDAVAKVAHGVGLSLPHRAEVTNPRANENPGVAFANAKKRWLDCEKSGATDCGPKPTAQGFIHVSPKPSESPEGSEGPGNHGQGFEHRHSPETTRTPHPTEHGEGQVTPRPTHTPQPTEHADDGHGSDDHTPRPSQTPGD